MEPVMLETSDGVAFRVDDVECGAMERSCMKAYPELIRGLLESNESKDVLSYPETQKDDSLIPIKCNGLLETVHLSYAKHIPLTLSPDEIWLAICQGLAIHVNEKMDSLENVLFKKKYIKNQSVVIRDDALEDGYVHWEHLIDSLANLMRQFSQVDLYSDVVQTFSTTTRVEKTVSQITVLDCLRRHVSYVAFTACGIPYVHLRGTTADWLRIKKSLDCLGVYGLKEWADALKPVIDEFVQASQGKPDVTFWKSIYKTMEEYSDSYVSGWIVKFFPYMKSEEYGDKYVYNPYLLGHDYILSDMTLQKFPSGLSLAPLTWICFGDTVNVSLCGGFVGKRLHADGSLEPAVSWFVTKGEVKEMDLGRLPVDCKLQWSNRVLDEENVLEKALYDSARFSTPEAGRSFLKAEVNSFLVKKYGEKVKRKIVEDTLNILLLMDGTVSRASLNRNDAKLNAAVDVFVKKFPGQWTPAISRIGSVLSEMQSEEKEKIVYTNYWELTKLMKEGRYDEVRRNMRLLDEPFPVNCVVKIPLK